MKKRWLKWVAAAALIIVLFPILFSLLLRGGAIITNWIGCGAITITDTYTIDFKSYLSVTVSMISCVVSATIAYNAFKLNKTVQENNKNTNNMKTVYYLRCIQKDFKNNQSIVKHLAKNSGGQVEDIETSSHENMPYLSQCLSKDEQIQIEQLFEIMNNIKSKEIDFSEYDVNAIIQQLKDAIILLERKELNYE